MDYDFQTNEDFAYDLDFKDPLSRLWKRFHAPEGIIYVDGNSLGLLSEDSEISVLRVLSEWKTLGIKGWLDGEPPWFYYAEKLGSMCSELIGAKPEEVVAANTTTINIHSLAHTLYKPNGKKKKILADELNYPTDIYALRSVIRLRGQNPEKDLILSPSNDGRYLNENKIVELMSDEVALVFLPSVLYRSGQLDIQYLVKEAHDRGIKIGFDCSHSVGVIPHYFDLWNVDFALWCSYKYLNGGPGSTAFLYLNMKHFDLEPALAGWFGYEKDRQFDLLLDFRHARNARGWKISSPSILSLASIEGSLKIILEAGIEPIRTKSLKMTSYLIYLIDEILSKNPYDFTVGTPREDNRRGGHVAIEHEEAMRISESLRIKGVISDFRPPNVIRIAPVPLYNTYHQIWRIVQDLKEIIDRKEYHKSSEHRRMIS